MAEETQEQEKIVPVQNCIRHWEKILFHDRAFLAISTQTIIEATIKHLKEKRNDKSWR